MTIQPNPHRRRYTLQRLAKLPEVAGCEAKLRMEGNKPYVTDNSNYIVDLYFEVRARAAACCAVCCALLCAAVCRCVLWATVRCVPLCAVRCVLCAAVSCVLCVVCRVLSASCRFLGPHQPLNHTPNTHQSPPPHHHQTPIKDAHAASKAILDLEGVVDHGLFLDMVDVCIIAGTTGVEVQERKK